MCVCVCVCVLRCISRTFGLSCPHSMSCSLGMGVFFAVAIPHSHDAFGLQLDGRTEVRMYSPKLWGASLIKCGLLLMDDACY